MCVLNIQISSFVSNVGTAKQHRREMIAFVLSQYQNLVRTPTKFKVSSVYRTDLLQKKSCFALVHTHSTGHQLKTQAAHQLNKKVELWRCKGFTPPKPQFFLKTSFFCISKVHTPCTFKICFTIFNILNMHILHLENGTFRPKMHLFTPPKMHFSTGSSKRAYSK